MHVCDEVHTCIMHVCVHVCSCLVCEDICVCAHVCECLCFCACIHDIYITFVAFPVYGPYFGGL